MTSRLREQCTKVIKTQESSLYPGNSKHFSKAGPWDSNTFTKNINMTHRNFTFSRYWSVRLPMLDNSVFSLCKACAVLVANKSGNLNAKITLKFKLRCITSAGPPTFGLLKEGVAIYQRHKKIASIVRNNFSKVCIQAKSNYNQIRLQIIRKLRSRIL